MGFCNQAVHTLMEAKRGLFWYSKYLQWCSK